MKLALMVIFLVGSLALAHPVLAQPTVTLDPIQYNTSQPAPFVTVAAPFFGDDGVGTIAYNTIPFRGNPRFAPWNRPMGVSRIQPAYPRYAYPQRQTVLVYPRVNRVNYVPYWYDTPYQYEAGTTTYPYIGY